MKFKDFVQDFVIITKGKITELAMSQLTNTQKKAQLDDYLLSYLQSFLGVFKLNFILKFIISKYLIPNIPTITQCVFDLIKARVEGVTK